MTKLRISVVCSGLGHVRRGFESFSSELSLAMANLPDIEFSTFGGGRDPSSQTRFVPCPKRSGALARFAARQLRRTPYFVEQAIFAIAVLPFLLRENVVITSDGTVSNVLWHFRRRLRLPYRIVFSNGAPFNPPYPRADLIHHVSPTSLETVSVVAHNESRHSFLPYGFIFPDQPPSVEAREHSPRRRQEGDKTLRVVSIGAIGMNHKRHDFVIEDLRHVPHAHLTIAGYPEPDTSRVYALAAESLPQRHRILSSITPKAVNELLLSSDVCVLASLQEGFGRIIVEAIRTGTPVLIHKSKMNESLFSGLVMMVDLEKPGSLATFLNCWETHRPTQDELVSAFRLARTKFSWEALAPSYADLFRSASDLPRLMTDHDLEREICPGYLK